MGSSSVHTAYSWINLGCRSFFMICASARKSLGSIVPVEGRFVSLPVRPVHQASIPKAFLVCVCAEFPFHSCFFCLFNFQAFFQFPLFVHAQVYPTSEIHLCMIIFKSRIFFSPHFIFFTQISSLLNSNNLQLNVMLRSSLPCFYVQPFPNNSISKGMSRLRAT